MLGEIPEKTRSFQGAAPAQLTQWSSGASARFWSRVVLEMLMISIVVRSET